MGINPSFKGKKKKKKNSGSPCSRVVSSCIQHQPQRRLRKQKDELRTWLLRSLFKGAAHSIDSQSTHTHTETEALSSAYSPSRSLGVHLNQEVEGPALRRGAERGPARAELPCRAWPQPGPPSALANPTRAHPAHRGLPRRLRPWGPLSGAGTPGDDTKTGRDGT